MRSYRIVDSQVKCTIIMYHYVRNMHETEYPDIKGLIIKKFVQQLSYITQNYAIIAIEDYIDFVKGKKIPKSSCILTFDDGLKDHYLNVFPILRDKKIPACFFPITQPLTELIVPCVHKVHFLLDKIGSKIFAEKFNQILKTDFSHLFDKFFVDNKAIKNRKYRWDTPLTANLKYNIAKMPEREKIDILARIFTKYFKNESKFCGELYLSFKDMRTMEEGGMSFGGHTHTHPMLSCLTAAEQADELKKSKEILENNLRTKIRAFAYPYGDYNRDTVNILKDNGYVCAVTTDVGVNIDNDVDHLYLKRLDTNDVPLMEKNHG